MNKFYAIPWVICFLFFQNITIHSQTRITGKISDKETGEDMISANIVVLKNGVFIQGETTDIDGNYSMRVDPGTYDMEISYTGYSIQKIKDVIVNAGRSTKLDLQLETNKELLNEIVTLEYKVPLEEIHRSNDSHSISDQIRNLPVRNINAVAAATAGVSNWIAGKITDVTTGEEIIAANIVVNKDGVFVNGEITDIDGNYAIQVDPGIYNIEVSYTGYATQLITDIVVKGGQTSTVNVQLDEGTIIDCCFGCWYGYVIPLIKQDETSTGITIEAERISSLPTRNINQMSLMVPGVSFIQ